MIKKLLPGGMKYRIGKIHEIQNRREKLTRRERLMTMMMLRRNTGSLKERKWTWMAVERILSRERTSMFQDGDSPPSWIRSYVEEEADIAYLEWEDHSQTTSGTYYLCHHGSLYVTGAPS